MTSIERTAYPRLKRRPSAQELADVYTPTAEDLAFIRATARGPSPTLTLAVLLKVFQQLGHMPRLQDVPFAVVAHIRSSLRLPADTALDVTPRTLYRHHEQIRTHLQVKSWGPEARRATIVAVHVAAQVMDHPADLINVALEELVRQRFELVRRCLRLYTYRGDLVIDPFCGRGTTPAVAVGLGRRIRASDLSRDYVDLTWQRVATARAEIQS